MLKTLIEYQMYIIMGILVFPIFAFIIYFTKNIIDRAKFMKTLKNMKKPLMERINSVVIIDEVKAEKEELNVIMYDIKNDIEILKQEINGTQETLALNNIEKEINMFCEKI